MEENRPLIKELPRETTDSLVVEEIVRLERRLFPKHESLSSSFYHELGKKNGGLLYCVLLDEGKPKEQVVGYVMYSFPSSLYASITKLADTRHDKPNVNDLWNDGYVDDECNGNKFSAPYYLLTEADNPNTCVGHTSLLCMRVRTMLD